MRSRAEVEAIVDDLEASHHRDAGFVLLDGDFTKLAERDPAMTGKDASAVVVYLPPPA